MYMYILVSITSTSILCAYGISPIPLSGYVFLIKQETGLQSQRLTRSQDPGPSSLPTGKGAWGEDGVIWRRAGGRALIDRKVRPDGQ